MLCTHMKSHNKKYSGPGKTKGVIVPRLNFNSLGMSPHMPKISGLPSIGSQNHLYQQQEEGASDDDGIDANDEINFPNMDAQIP